MAKLLPAACAKGKGGYAQSCLTFSKLHKHFGDHSSVPDWRHFDSRRDLKRNVFYLTILWAKYPFFWRQYGQVSSRALYQFLICRLLFWINFGTNRSKHKNMQDNNSIDRNVLFFTVGLFAIRYYEPMFISWIILYPLLIKVNILFPNISYFQTITSNNFPGLVVSVCMRMVPAQLLTSATWLTINNGLT
jgi:hypothetical protein